MTYSTRNGSMYAMDSVENVSSQVFTVILKTHEMMNCPCQNPEKEIVQEIAIQVGKPCNIHHYVKELEVQFLFNLEFGGSGDVTKQHLLVIIHRV